LTTKPEIRIVRNVGNLKKRTEIVVDVLCYEIDYNISISSLSISLKYEPFSLERKA